MDLLFKLNLIVSPVPKTTRPHQHGALSCVFLNGMNMAKLCLIDQWVVERQCVLSFMIYWAHCRQRSSTAAVFFLSDQLNETCSRIRLNLKLLCWCVKCSGCYRLTGWVEAGDGDVFNIALKHVLCMKEHMSGDDPQLLTADGGALTVKESFNKAVTEQFHQNAAQD